MGAWIWGRGWLLLSLAMLFWAGNSVVGRMVNEAVPPIGLAFWRWVAASAVILPIAWPHVRRDWETLKRHRILLAVMALLGLAGFNALLYAALHTTTAINTVLLQSATPPLIFLASFLMFGERARWLQIAGLVVALAGVGWIVSQGEPGSLMSLQFRVGDGLMLIAVAAYALYSALLRRKPDVDPLSFLAATCALSILVLAPAYVTEHLAGYEVRADGPTLAALVYVAIFPSVLAYLFFNRGVEIMGANKAGQFMNLMPAFGAFLSVVFLGEGLQMFHFVGLLLIATGIGISSRR